MTQRVALVTGAMGGLGTAICQELAKAGHKVVAAYHPQFDNKDAWLADMAAAGFKDFVCVAGDVSVLEDCQKMVAEAEAACGQVDILINNAGITRDRMFAKMERDGWDAVIATNLTSLFNMTKQVSAKMAERGWGRMGRSHFEQEADHGSMVVGSPETAARKIAAGVKALACQQI